MKRIAVVWIFLASGSALAGSGPVEPPVMPVTDPPSKSICIIENRETRPTFLEAYRAELLQRGFKVAVLKEPEALYDCPMTSTYDAEWASDAFIGFIYSIAYARLNVYHDGRMIGYAMYQRPNGYVIRKGDNKVQELVAALFPGS